MKRVFGAAKVTAAAALLVWVITAAHGIWSIGYGRDFLGERHPLYPTFTVNYGTFLFESLSTPFVMLVCGLPALSLLWNSARVLPLAAIALMAARIGAESIAWNYQFAFGTTWGYGEAVLALFFHPVVTPLSAALILAGCAGLVRLLRDRPDRG